MSHLSLDINLENANGQEGGKLLLLLNFLISLAFFSRILQEEEQEKEVKTVWDLKDCRVIFEHLNETKPNEL